MKNESRIPLFVALFPLAILVVILVHEYGHVAIARLFGDPQASYSLYKRYPSGGFCIGCYSFGVLSDTGSTFVKIGGVIFTQLFFIAIIATLGTKVVSFTARLPMTIIAVLFFLDRHFKSYKALERLLMYPNLELTWQTSATWCPSRRTSRPSLSK